MVEGARLEIVWAGDRLGGSNPLASARFKSSEKRSFSRDTKRMKNLELALVFFIL